MKVTSETSAVSPENSPRDPLSQPKNSDKTTEIGKQAIIENSENNWKQLNQRLSTFKKRYVSTHNNFHDGIKEINKIITINNEQYHSNVKNPIAQNYNNEVILKNLKELEVQKENLLLKSKVIINPTVAQTIWKINREQDMMSKRLGPYTNSRSDQEDFNILMSNVFNIDSEELEYAISHFDEVFSLYQEQDINSEQFMKFVLDNTVPLPDNELPLDILKFIDLGNKLKNYSKGHQSEMKMTHQKLANDEAMEISSEFTNQDWEELENAVSDFKNRSDFSRLGPYISNKQEQMLNRIGSYEKSLSKEEDSYIFIADLLNIPVNDVKTAVDLGGLFHGESLQGFNEFAKFFINYIKKSDERKIIALLNEFKKFVDERIIEKSARDFIENASLNQREQATSDKVAASLKKSYRLFETQIDNALKPIENSMKGLQSFLNQYPLKDNSHPANLQLEVMKSKFEELSDLKGEALTIFNHVSKQEKLMHDRKGPYAASKSQEDDFKIFINTALDFQAEDIESIFSQTQRIQGQEIEDPTQFYQMVFLESQKQDGIVELVKIARELADILNAEE